MNLELGQTSLITKLAAYAANRTLDCIKYYFGFYHRYSPAHHSRSVSMFGRELQTFRQKITETTPKLGNATYKLLAKCVTILRYDDRVEVARQLSRNAAESK